MKYWRTGWCWLLVGLPLTAQAAFQAGALAGPKEGRSLPFAGELSVGWLNGEAKEHVFDYETPDGRRRQLSRLDWELKNILMGGGNGSVRLGGRLTVNGGFWLALTEGSGEMEDYDWLDLQSEDWTHYSLSEVEVTEGYRFDLNAAWDLVQWRDLTARLMAGYKQDGWTWEDRGVYLLYPEYGYIPVDLGGLNMVNYEQEFRMPYLGASADWQWRQWTLSGYVNWSPLVSAEDWDEHVDRELFFHETFEGGDSFGCGARVRYDFTQGFFKGAFVSAALDYQSVDLIVGDMEVYDAATGMYGGEQDVAGIENRHLVWSLGLGAKF